MSIYNRLQRIQDHGQTEMSFYCFLAEGVQEVDCDLQRWKEKFQGGLQTSGTVRNPDIQESYAKSLPDLGGRLHSYIETLQDELGPWGYRFVLWPPLLTRRRTLLLWDLSLKFFLQQTVELTILTQHTGASTVTLIVTDFI